MNDYLIERYSKNDLREFWSVLLEHKNELLKAQQTQHEHPSYFQGAINSITFCMEGIEKRFDLF